MADCEPVATDPANAPEIPIFLSQAHRGQRVEVQLYDRNGGEKGTATGVVELMLNKMNNYLDRFAVYDLIGEPVIDDPAVSYCKYDQGKYLVFRGGEEKLKTFTQAQMNSVFGDAFTKDVMDAKGKALQAGPLSHLDAREYKNTFRDVLKVDVVMEGGENLAVDEDNPDNPTQMPGDLYLVRLDNGKGRAYVWEMDLKNKNKGAIYEKARALAKGAYTADPSNLKRRDGADLPPTFEGYLTGFYNGRNKMSPKEFIAERRNMKENLRRKVR